MAHHNNLSDFGEPLKQNANKLVNRKSILLGMPSNLSYRIPASYDVVDVTSKTAYVRWVGKVLRFSVSV